MFKEAPRKALKNLIGKNTKRGHFLIRNMARLRNGVCNFFVANCPSNFLRVLFLKLGGTKVRGKIHLDKGNFFTDFTKVDIDGKCIIGRNNIFLSRGGIKIGKNCLISGYSFFITQSHELESEKFNSVFKPITIDNNCWIGINATILPGVLLENGCVVGAGAVVTKGFPKNSVVGGNPAKEIGKRNRNSHIPIN